MKIVFYIALTLMVCLALASGIAKIMLAPQEVAFFSALGVSNSALVAFGVLQALGGIMLVFARTRVMGAVVVALTFLVSAVLLLQAGSTMLAVITLVCVTLLGAIVKLTPLPAEAEIS